MKKIFLLLTSFIIFTGCIVQHEKESDVIISVVPTNEVVSINEETNALDSNIQFTMTQITENINPIELEEIEVDYCDSVLGDYKIKELDTYLLNQGSSASIVISSVINSTVIYRLSEELIIPVNFTFKFKTSSDLEKKVHTSVLLNYIEEESRRQFIISLYYFSS